MRLHLVLILLLMGEVVRGERNMKCGQLTQLPAILNCSNGMRIGLSLTDGSSNQGCTIAKYIECQNLLLMCQSLLGSSSENQSPEVDNGPVVALGILLALSMVLLAAVTIGWVTTYLIMKKREVAKNFSCNSARMDNGTGATVNTVDNDEDERYFQNPTYGEGGPSTNTRTGTTTTGAGAMYAVVDQLSRRTRPTVVTTENSRRQDSNGQGHSATLMDAKGSTQSHMTSQEYNGQSGYYEIKKDFMDDDQQSYSHAQYLTITTPASNK